MLRPMEAGDLAACEALWQSAWAALQLAQASQWPPPSAEDRARLRRRIEHLRRTDPEGSWVAEDDGVVTGLAQSFVRQGLWVLSRLGVVPSSQSSGVGRSLLEAALGHGDRDGPGLILSSPDPRAMHRYVSAGFALHPALAAVGPLVHSRLPDPDSVRPEVRPAGREDLPHLGRTSRRLRGAVHDPDLGFLLDEGALLLGLELRGQGAVMVRGEPGPLRPYLPSGAFG